MIQRPQSAEILPGPGFQIRRNIDRPEQSLYSKFAEFGTPDISDMMNRLYTMSPEIKNVVNDERILGPACTVKVFPGDNLMVHKALDLARPGDIVVVDAGASAMNGVLGDLISTKGKHRGIAAFVVDGLVRDIDGIRESGMTVFARGVTPIGPLHRGPGEINFPVSCGGIVVNPGDIIVGDWNGVVVVRKEMASELLNRLHAQRAKLHDYIQNVRKGVFSNEWVDAMLDAAHCAYVD